MTREDAELCGWGLRNVDHGRRWVARRGADVVSGYSLAGVLEQVERETTRIIREAEERTPTPDGEPTRSDLLRAGWRFKPYVIEPTAGPHYASGWHGWQALKDGVRVYCGDTQAEVVAAATEDWKAARSMNTQISLPGFGPALSQKDGTARDLLSACGGAVRGAEAGPATADTPVATAPRSLGLIRQKGTNVIVDSDGRGYDDAEFRPFADRGWLVTRGVAPWIGRRGNQAVFARTRGELVRMLQHRTTSRPAAGTSSTTTNDEGTTP